MSVQNKYEKKDGDETIFMHIVKLLFLSILGGTIMGLTAGIALKLLKFYFNNPEMVQFY